MRMLACAVAAVLGFVALSCGLNNDRLATAPALEPGCIELDSGNVDVTFESPIPGIYLARDAAGHAALVAAFTDPNWDDSPPTGYGGGHGRPQDLPPAPGPGQVVAVVHPGLSCPWTICCARHDGVDTVVETVGIPVPCGLGSLEAVWLLLPDTGGSVTTAFVPRGTDCN